MHKSPVRLIRRHAHRTGKRSGEEEEEDDSVSSHKRGIAKQHLKRQRDRDNSQGKVKESLVLNIIDAKGSSGGGNERLATNRLATKGAEKLPPITLGSYVTPAGMLPTPLYPPSGTATPVALPSTLSLNTAHQSQATSTEVQDKFYWSLAVGIMFTALVLVSLQHKPRFSLLIHRFKADLTRMYQVYTLSVVRSLVHA